jgi:uncharacterized protein YegL
VNHRVEDDWSIAVDIAPMNYQKRLPAVLLLDTSASMDGAKIAELNNGLKVLEQHFDPETGDPTVLRSVELALVTFGAGGVNVIDLKTGRPTSELDQAFVEAGQFVAPTLTTGGSTPLGQAMDLALDTLTSRKSFYKANGIPYNRPWIFLISDGAPDHGWEASADRASREVAGNHTIVWSIGVDGADLGTLARFSGDRPAFPLKGLYFSELFEFISNSVSGASTSDPSNPTYEINLEDLAKWAQIPLSNG